MYYMFNRKEVNMKQRIIHTKKQREYKIKIREIMNTLSEGKYFKPLHHPEFNHDEADKVVNIIMQLRFPTLKQHMRKEVI